MHEITDDTVQIVNEIYKRKMHDGWSESEAADLCDWLLFVKPVDGEPREVTRMRLIRETCAGHGMMDILTPGEGGGMDWEPVAFGAGEVTA